MHTHTLVLKSQLPPTRPLLCCNLVCNSGTVHEVEQEAWLGQRCSNSCWRPLYVIDALPTNEPSGPNALEIHLKFRCVQHETYRPGKATERHILDVSRPLFEFSEPAPNSENGVESARIRCYWENVVYLAGEHPDFTTLCLFIILLVCVVLLVDHFY